MLDTHSEVKEKPGAQPLARLTRGVEFRDVGFAYDDEPAKFVLRNVSLSAKAGQVVSIVGLSGAGKTTLVNLIPRFYDVTEGAILIDGMDIRDVTLRSLRQEIALVTQETDPLRRHDCRQHRLRAPGASQSDIEAAAKAAHAHEFITTLSDGYQARIGERGQRLSGGQRQRLAIAGRCSRTARCLCSTRRPRRSTPIRAARPGRAGQPDAQSHDVRDCAPALDSPPRRPARGDRGRPRGRDGDAKSWSADRASTPNSTRCRRSTSARTARQATITGRSFRDSVHDRIRVGQPGGAARGSASR
jgi:ABC-type lipoprotein export system ATPase subunit